MECEVFILPDWSPPDNPIQSERASSSIMECEEFILPDWSPFDDPARVLVAEGRRNPSTSNREIEVVKTPCWVQGLDFIARVFIFKDFGITVDLYPNSAEYNKTIC